MSRQPKERPDVRLFTEIGVISQLVRTTLERVLPAGLSYAQFSVLVHFAHHAGEESPAKLAKAFQVTKGAMTNTLQRLETQGFVHVEGDAGDGRRKRVTITATGLAAHDRAIAATRPVLTALRAQFSDAEFNDALPFLTALRGWLDENRWNA